VGLLVIEMDISEEFSLGHLLLHERVCRTCGVEKNLVDNFYRTRKDRGPVSSSYSYECKECCKKRVLKNKIKKYIVSEVYPDW
jgi:hypothetical protein|tara:strand:+ start:53 stop:301 length:249 start_codon:yes stop_codon:yes gene_type:complete